MKRQRTENAARIEAGGLMILILPLLWIGFGPGSGDISSINRDDDDECNSFTYEYVK